jgi:hypothetical protein
MQDLPAPPMKPDCTANVQAIGVMNLAVDNGDLLSLD